MITSAKSPADARAANAYADAPATDLAAVKINIKGSGSAPYQLRIDRPEDIQVFLENNTGFDLKDVTLKIPDGLDVSLDPLKYEISTSTLTWANVPMGTKEQRPDKSNGRDITIKLLGVQVPSDTEVKINAKTGAVKYTLVNTVNGDSPATSFRATNPIAR